MPFTSGDGNKKIEELFKSIKKNDTTTNQLTSDDKFVAPKRRRRFQPGTREELTKLFDKISDDPFYENKISSFSNDDNVDCDSSPTEHDLARHPPYTPVDQQLQWLYSGPPSDGDNHSDDSIPTVDDLARMADGFLEEELTAQLKHALVSTELQDSGGISYRFFSEHCKLPEPSLHLENMDKIDISTKKKYYHIVKYSQPEDKRHFFLSTRQLALWYRLGWECPHSVLRWLIAVVAFDKNIETARLAMNTIFELWFDLLRKKLSIVSMADGINYDRKMTVDLFSYIMTSYGALDLPTIHDTDAPVTYPEKVCDDVIMTEEGQEGSNGEDRIPLTQFGWVLDLLKLSLTLWPEAYTISQLHYLANTLVCLGMDDVGVLVLKHIQDALEACLRALPGGDDDSGDDDGLNWKTQVHQLAFSLCKQQFVTLELQVRLPTITKSTCDRCFYLRRVISLIALELAMKKDQQKTTNINTTMATVANGAVDPLLPLASSQVTLESLSPYLDSDGDGMIPLLVAMVEDPCSVFQEADPCYRDYADRVCLLDYAVGNDYTEFMMCIDEIRSLVTQLQASSRKIGGCLGTLERTKANEVTQRLWSRLAYVIGRNGNTVKDIEF